MSHLAHTAVDQGARFSPDGVYRYRLWRTVGPPRSIGTCLFVMLNPSTADDFENDPTVRRCIGFARGWGYGRLEVANLFAYRAADPDELWDVVDPVGPDNDAEIAAAARGAGRVVIAWGVNGSFKGRDEEVLAILRSELWHRGFDMWCLGRTSRGLPRHPLYVRGDTELEVYRR